MRQIELPSWDSSRFSVTPNKDLLAKLTASMVVHSETVDSGPWTRLPDELTAADCETMLDSWCGTVGKLCLSDPKKISEYFGDTELYEAFDRQFRSIDHLHLLNGISLSDLGARGWRSFYLGSLMDFLILSAFYKFNGNNVRVMEIGGEFGRLGKFLHLLAASKLRYINIDAAPVSLMYSYEYLKSRFPEQKTVLFSPRDPAPDYDFLIVPSWFADELPKQPTDLAVNIESMQEMNQFMVDFYLSYIDDRAAIGSLIYLVKSREHLFRGEWNFPNSWEILFRHRTVRSWTNYHPVEVFRKTDVDFSAVNWLRRSVFAKEVDAARQIVELKQLRHDIAMGRLVPNHRVMDSCLGATCLR